LWLREAHEVRQRHHIRQKIFLVLIFLASWLLTASSVCGGTTETSGVYRTAASIRSLSLEQLALRYPAQVRGVVTQSTDDGLVIQDTTAGIWIYWNRSDDFSAGDEVEVRGVVDPGLFAPSIRAFSVDKLGRAPLPKPKKVALAELNAGAEDCQYVSVTGTVLSAGLRRGASEKQKLWLRIAVEHGVVNATFPAEDAPDAAKLIDAVVRINAPAMGTKNDNRQITAATLSVAGMSNVTVLQPAPANLFAQPLTPIGRLMQYRSGTDYNHRVRVAGTVTYYKPGENIVLEDDGKALFVATTQSRDIQLGDRVEALGFPAPHSAGPILRDAVLRRVAAGQPLQPTSVRLAEICSGALNYNLVRTEGQLLRRVREPSRDVLLLQDDADSVLVELAQSGSTSGLQALQEGSLVQVSAISILEVDGTWNYGVSSASAIRCKLLLRSPDDVRMLQPASWWTTRHVFYIAAILGALVLAFLCLVVYSRVEHWRLRAIHEERERLAHEIHDTLAQSFSGIGFQLQAIRKAIPQESPGLRKQVDLACDLVRHSHKEARRSIEPLRLDPREKVDLLFSLESSARKMVEGGSVEVEATRSGSPRPISPLIADTLLRIGQESIANAVRHADPSRLQISLHWEQEVVRLAVRDNGIGFVKSGGLLGFGLRGMRKRAADIGAKLEIFSQPRAGTRVEVTAYVPPSKSPAALLKRTWMYLLERGSRVEAKQ
jgi:signal transduction histidine kinase